MIRSLAARHRWSLLASSVVLLVYVSSLSLMPIDVFWSPDEGGKFFELASLRWDGGLEYALPYVGRRLDPELRFYLQQPDTGATFPYPEPVGQGQVRFHWPIWFPLLSRVLFEAFGLPGIYLVPLLSGWLIAVVSGWIAARFDSRLAAPAILLVGLATPIWFYSLTFWEHTLAVLLGWLAIAALIGSRPGSARGLAGMLMLVAAAMALRIEMLALAAALIAVWGLEAWRARAGGAATAAAAARPRLKWIAWAGVAAVGAALVLVVAGSLVGRHREFITSLPARIVGTSRTVGAVPRAVASVLVNSSKSEGPTTSLLWLGLGAAAAAACFAAPFVPKRYEGRVLVPALAAVLVYSLVLLLRSESYRSLHGLFPIAPYMVLWTYAFVAVRRRATRLGALAEVALVYLLAGVAAMFLFHVDHAGRLTTGLEWGQRYLLPLYPLLAVLSLVALSELRRSARPEAVRTWVVVLAAALIAVGVQFQLRGLVMLRANHRMFASWQPLLLNGDPVVTDNWWIPATLAPLFALRETYFVRDRAQIAEWVALARGHGVSTFTFASQRPLGDDDFRIPGVQRRREVEAVPGLFVARLELAGPP